MLLNVSYNRPKIKNQIDENVGRAFSFVDRVKMGGIGSGKLIINSSSKQIYNLLILDSYRNVCSIEMRPKGIILSFRSLLETYALVIPFHKLKIYKGRSQEYSVYMDDYFIKIKADNKRIHKYMRKVLDYKLSSSEFKNEYYE
ncbi:MAG: hypothetical protein GVY05_00500 [Bacteroidetes bacterium]|jgi:hypothetical protein|nr:hypothetical protein [Bacteroidota bacterium]